MNFRDGITPVLDGMRRALSQRGEAAPCPPPPIPPAIPIPPPARSPHRKPFNLSTFQLLNRAEGAPPLHNLLAPRKPAHFPMIGKKVSNGWKTRPDFSNDWKNFSPLFQRLEKISVTGKQSDNYDNSRQFFLETTWTTLDNPFKVRRPTGRRP